MEGMSEKKVHVHSFLKKYKIIKLNSYYLKAKKSESRLDKHKKRFIEIKKNAKSSRAVTMVAAGGK